MIYFGNGVSSKTDYFSSIPNPPRIYVRLIEMSMEEAMRIATNAEAMKQIKYLKYTFFDCEMLALINDRGVPKLSLSYTSMVKEP